MSTSGSSELVALPRVVVGVDGSSHSLLALRWAADYAAAVRASLEVVSAWHVPSSWGPAGLPVDWDPEIDAEQALERSIAEVFGGRVPANLVRSVRRGTAAQVLLDAAEDAAIVVVGSRGHGGFVGMLLGSVSAAVAEHAPCPVLVVHGDRPPLALSA